MFGLRSTHYPNSKGTEEPNKRMLNHIVTNSNVYFGRKEFFCEKKSFTVRMQSYPTIACDSESLCEIVKISAGDHGSISDQSFSIKKSLFFALIERFEIGLVIKIVNHFNRLSGTLSFEPSNLKKCHLMKG